MGNRGRPGILLPGLLLGTETKWWLRDVLQVVPGTTPADRFDPRLTVEKVPGVGRCVQVAETGSKIHSDRTSWLSSLAIPAIHSLPPSTAAVGAPNRKMAGGVDGIVVHWLVVGSYTSTAGPTT